MYGPTLTQPASIHTLIHPTSPQQTSFHQGVGITKLENTPATMNGANGRSASPTTSGDNGSPSAHHLSPDENPNGSKGRTLSNSKRAEQNRRAQRAFRMRRDARVKYLEEQAALLQETLAHAEATNKRWEECRALVDQLRHENSMLRSALENAGIDVESISNQSTTSSNLAGATSAPATTSPNGVDGDAHRPLLLHTTQSAYDDAILEPSKKRKRIIETNGHVETAS
ncbi:SubName: Full=Uncharacterized protein {ECO:0000313/EMBL:CCA75671.1} [Serendipita indica DSM 11827]|uniref:BZIP domain-containing protein n=1 Tax=Serendipita indica (strain DSM 11827) TaxID=1109443 RepID=G4TWH8_SERID|nr:SubName: Full=Uncharacterized protein {ECO:0000313/EMBL:CCA75671.1} [Serendipita indica DSM 11827]CCA75671.1 hypothetical protein PIIN_09661 [Serendipita indica DSM 11827]